MNEFNFRVANAAPRASSFEIGKNVGDIQTTYIYSYKTKYINGKSTGQKTNVDWDMESSIPGWVSVKYTFEGNDCKVTFTTLEENTGSSARTHTLVMKQRESGETISFPISQEPNFTYTYFLVVLNTSVTIGANIGNTTTIMVRSHMTRSDGEIMAKHPSVGATPSWASKVTVKDGSVIAGAPHWYQIIVEATAANPGSERSGTILVTCGDQRKEATIWQKALDPIIKLELSFADQSSALVDQGPVPYTLSYNDQFLETGTIPAGGVIQVPQNTWAYNGGDTAIYTLYLKGSEIKAGSTFYFQCRFYAINGWEGLLVDPEYNKALNYKIDTVQPSWNPSGTIQSGTIYLYKGNLSPSDFSGGILIELTLGTEINGYVKKAMIRVKVN